MNHLTKLTPAETLLILQGDQADLKTLLKYTFMDLLIRDVITIEKVPVTNRTSGAREWYKYVNAGGAFNTHIEKSHERVLLKSLRADGNTMILLPNFIKLAFENSTNAETFKHNVRRNKDVEALFSRTFWQWFNGTFGHSHRGKVVKDEILVELRQWEHLWEEEQKNKKRDLSKFKPLGGNFLLLRNTSLELVHEVEQELSKHQYPANPSCSTSACTTTTDAFDSASHHHDTTSSDGGSGSGDNGCAGDSGCNSD